jgi:hypothetical protein
VEKKSIPDTLLFGTVRISDIRFLQKAQHTSNFWVRSSSRMNITFLLALGAGGDMTRIARPRGCPSGIHRR